MGYSAVWKVLEEMVTDFRKKGITVPAEIVSNLRHAQALINVLGADPTRLDTSQKVEGYLLSVESYLVSEGQKKLGEGCAENWLKRLSEASGKVVEEEGKETTFVSGVPRAQKWIRVKPSADLPIEGIKVLADELCLSFNLQNDGCLLVYGKEEHIKDFVKKMTMKYGLKAGK